MKSLGIFFVFSSFITFVVCLLSQTDYCVVGVLPFSYIFLSFFLFYSFKKRVFPITVLIIGVLLWIRMVLIPFMGVTDSLYQTNLFKDDELAYDAIKLCVYEGWVITIFLGVLTKIKRPSTGLSTPRRLEGSLRFYWIIILIALGVYFTIGRNMHLFEFAIKTVGETTERGKETLDAFPLLIRQIVSCGFLFVFFVWVERNRKKYMLSSNSMYSNLAILGALLLVCVIIGERRSSQIYIAFASCWLLVHVFNSQKRKIISYVVGTTAFVLIMMTIYKVFNAFLFSSYSEALQNSDVSSGFSASMIDAYFYGINTIAKNLSFGHVADLNILNFLYDILRSTFGLNFLAPHGISLTSQYYNLYLYGGEQSTGYLLSSVGYGYIYFGFILSPFISCLNIFFLTFMERKMKNVSSIEMSYIWAYLYMRFAFSLLGSLPPLISLSSRFLFFNGGIYYIAKKIKGK